MIFHKCQNIRHCLQIPPKWFWPIKIGVGEVRSHTCNLLIAICMLVISTWRKNKDTALPLFLLLAAQDEEAEAA